MPAFRLLLVVLFIGVLSYTSVVVSRHGLDFMPVFSGDIAKLGWAGQFNVDFMCLLLLSALWVAWRHQFSAAGLILALLVPIGGTPFLCVYLLVQSVRCGGDAGAMIVGDRWPARR